MKKLYIFSILLFLISTLLPFVKKGVVYTTPLVIGMSVNQKDFFIETTLRSEFIEEDPIIFAYDKEAMNSDIPDVTASSALVVDASTKRVLYAKNEKEKLPVASLAKMMTAIVAIEHFPLDKKIRVSERATRIGENTMGLVEGEKFVLKDLLYGLILNSGNDAAYAISEAIAGSEEDFVEFMNRKAKLLWANNTVFADSSGLNKESKEFYSTAEDMAKIALYSQEKHSELKEIYKTVIKELPATDEYGYKYLENQTNLLTTYPGVQGMKTGYTEDSGLCLVSYAENDGKKILVVVLNSIDRKGDAIILLDYGFNRLGINVEHNLL